MSKIRTFQPEDINYVIEAHRRIYDVEYGLDMSFGDYVETYALQFLEQFDSNQENLWIAEIDGKPVGAIAIVKASDETAQLRWFILEREARGKGLGHQLIQTALSFCKEKGYSKVFLGTIQMLTTARYLYQHYGFTLTESTEQKMWGKEVLVEERWDLIL